jgi:hypothetical protein
MKKIKIWLGLALLVLGLALGFCLGRQYEYEYYGAQSEKAAGLFSDIIRNYTDFLEENDSVEDYGAFEEIVETFLDDEDVKLRDYSWAY